MYNIVNGTAPKNMINTFTNNKHTHKLSFSRSRNNLFKSSLLFSGRGGWGDGDAFGIIYLSVLNQLMEKAQLKKIDR